jgi:glycerol-3-phosphate acyltransferase PlsY
MPPPTTLLWVAIASYALGCFCTGYYLVRWWSGRDVRAGGSGAVGAANTRRALGWWGFLATFLGDAGKGAAAVLLARAAGLHGWGEALALLLVVAGHLWPAQLRFRGGKGVATSLGGLAVLDPRLSLAILALFLVALLDTRRSMLSGMLAIATSPALGMAPGRPFPAVSTDVPGPRGLRAALQGGTTCPTPLRRPAARRPSAWRS